MLETYLQLFGEVFDDTAEFVSLLGGSSPGSESSLNELESSLFDLADPGLEHFENSLFKASHAGNRLDDLSDGTNSFTGSSLSVDWPFGFLDLCDDKSFVEADCEAIGKLGFCHYSTL